MPKVGMAPIRRRQIIDAVLEIIGEDGWDALTIKTVCERAGVSTGIVAHYFGNKDAMMSDAIRDAYRRFSGDVARVIEDHRTPRAKLIALTVRLMPSPQGVPDWPFWIALWGRVPFDDTIRVELQDVYRQYTMLVRNIVEAGIREGSFRRDADPALVADQFVGLAQGFGLRVQVDEDFGGESLRHRMLAFLSAQLDADFDAEEVLATSR